jgi:CRISPR system Cascade subunit CasD
VTTFLIATVYAPLASWGDIAVGESRGSWDRPSRSAVLGLVAAALGLTRDDQRAHDALDAGYGVAVRLDSAGTPLTDYHTTQTVAGHLVKKQGPRTRASLLGLGPRETILSRRIYRENALATIALWARQGAQWSLESLATALRCPAFVLYAGRKSNPLAVPLNPALVEAESLAEALSMREPWPLGVETWPRRRRSTSEIVEVAHDRCDGFPSGLQHIQQVIRRDAAADRSRWQFSERVVDVSVISSGTGGPRA